MHKEEVAGGMWYGVAVPNTVDDPSLLEERHKTTFCGYLELVMKWGGFPGLDSCEAEHSWPVEELVRGIT